MTTLAQFRFYILAKMANIFWESVYLNKFSGQISLPHRKSSCQTQLKTQRFILVKKLYYRRTALHRTFIGVLMFKCRALNSTKGDEDLGAALFRNDENKTRNGNLLSLLFHNELNSFINSHRNYFFYRLKGCEMFLNTK